MRKFNYGLLVVFFAMIVSSLFAQAEKSGAISGYVKDSRNKNPLNEAVITITSTAFEGSKFALTDSTGIYSVKNLPAGNYTVSFEMEGYKKFIQENIILKEGQSLGVSFQMARDVKRKSKGQEKLVIQ